MSGEWSATLAAGLLVRLAATHTMPPRHCHIDREMRNIDITLRGITKKAG